MGIAAQVAARWVEWPGRDYLAAPSMGGGSNPITFPTTPLRLKVELQLGGNWVDITSYIYKDTRIKITRGRGNEATRAQPSKCTVRLKNPNRVWSPRNAGGPYYGLLNRNVKLRVTVNPGDADYVRYTGFVSQWPQQWSTGNHRWVDLQAFGILKRLGQGQSALRTPIYRSVSARNPLAYWTLTDTSGTTAGASEVATGTEFTLADGAVFAGTTVPDGSPAVVVNAGSGRGLIPSTGSSTLADGEGFIVGFGMKVVGVPVDALIDRPYLSFKSPNGSTVQWDVVPITEDGGLPVQVIMRDSAGTYTNGFDIGPFYDGIADMQANFNDTWNYYQFTVKRVGANVEIVGYFNGAVVHVGSLPTAGFLPLGRMTEVDINLQGRDWSTFDLALSSISVLPTSSMAGNTDGAAFHAFVGEAPTTRFARLCNEEGLDYTIVETGPDTEGMGPQAVDTVLNLLRACEATNEGVLDEDFQGRLRLLSRTSTWSQPASMIVNYTSGPHGAIKDGFKPTDDDLLVRNDWTITRQGGNSRRFVQSEGPLNVNDPSEDPQGISRYDDSATLSLAEDDQAFTHASLRVARGTVDEMRIAEMPLHFTSTPDLLDEWLKMDINSGWKIINTPVDMGSIPAWQIMTGYSEEFDQIEWRASLAGAPASPEQIGILDNGTPSGGRLNCGACTLAEDLDTTETAIDVAIADTCTWVNFNLPYGVSFSGEDVLVTAAAAPVGAGSSWTQTLTVIRSVNGVVKTHSTGARVNVTAPFILGL